MKKTLVLILCGITLLCSCSSKKKISTISSSLTSSSQVPTSQEILTENLKNAEYLGELENNMSSVLCIREITAHQGDTLYYKFSLKEEFILDLDEYNALNLVTSETKKTDANWSYIYECHFYNSTYNELSVIRVSEIESYQYDGAPLWGEGCYIVNSTVPAGDYYFSITMLNEPESSLIDIYLSAYIGE